MYQRPGRGIRLNMAGPSQPSGALARRVLAVLLALAITVLAVAQYRFGRGPVVVAWLAVGPLLGSLLLRPLVTAVLAGWATLLGVGLIVDQPPGPGAWCRTWECACCWPRSRWPTPCCAPRRSGG